MYRKNYLEEFFAVTITGSVYRVRAHDECGDPCAEKVAVTGDSHLQIGTRIKRLGGLLAVEQHIRAFIPEGNPSRAGSSIHERRLERVPTEWWMGKTAKIVALFFSRRSAEKCAHAEGLQPADDRWIETTREVLDSIGNDHPTITICKHPQMVLLDRPTLVSS